MARETFRLTKAVGEFEEGDVVEVTARYGGWHPSDVKIEPRAHEPPASLELDDRRLKQIAERTADRG